MDDGWDLHAVIRSSAAPTSVPDAAAASTSFTAAVPVNTPTAMDLGQEGFYRSMAIRNEHGLVNYKAGGLEEVHMEGRTQSSVPCTTSGTSISFDGGQSAHEQPSIFGDPISFSIKPVDSQPIQATNRKKKKRVVELREEELSNDGWAWRKYGQKPIKGTPHPRNYYRCSTTKDCLARKQVERSPTDTSKFIVSYSGDHLHPRPTHLISSLAGTARSSKFSTTEVTMSPAHRSVMLKNDSK